MARWRKLRYCQPRRTANKTDGADEAPRTRLVEATEPTV